MGAAVYSSGIPVLEEKKYLKLTNQLPNVKQYLTHIQMQILVEKSILNWISLKQKQISCQTVHTNGLLIFTRSNASKWKTDNMNYSTLSAKSVSCTSVPYLPMETPERLSPALRDVFILRITVNAISCPFVILLNILVMAAVKTNRQLRTKSNVSLACLATTDLVVGLVVQPLQIVHYSFMLGKVRLA